MIFDDLLSESSKHFKKQYLTPEFKNKMLNVLFTQLLTDSDPAFSAGFLRKISSIIYMILDFIEQADDIINIIKQMKEIFNPNKRESDIFVGRTAVKENLPELTKKDQEAFLEKQYIENMNKLQQINSHSPEVTLLIDGSHENISSKYQNNDLAYIVKGQTNTWIKGFCNSITYDATHKQMIGVEFINNHVEHKDKNDFPAFIQRIQQKVSIINKTGSHVYIIQADRGYYLTEIFASSYLGLLAPKDALDSFVRIMTPTKFTREKTNKKWDFLLNQSSKDVELINMGLNYYCNRLIRDKAKEFGLSTVNSLFQIPVASVALFDEYKKLGDKSMEWAHLRANQIQNNLNTEEKLLKDAESKFIQFPMNSKEKNKVPSFKKGAKKKKFSDTQEKLLYHECYDHYKQIEQLKKEKEKIINNLIFFTISLSPNENPERYPEKYIRLAREYHTRWDIENGIRDLKYHFKLLSRSRRPVIRQFQWLFGALCYNNWELFRIVSHLKNKRKRYHRVKHYDSRRPHMIKRLSRELSRYSSAECYLVQVWDLCIKNRLMEIFNKIKKCY